MSIELLLLKIFVIIGNTVSYPLIIFLRFYPNIKDIVGRFREALPDMADAPDANKFPGFGLPVDQTKYAEATYGHALSAGFISDGVTVRERRMLEFMSQVTDKPEWERKVFDEEIVDKWRAEASAKVQVKGIEDVYLSEAMFEYCLKELRDKADNFKKKGTITVLDAELIIAKSDTLVSTELDARLRKSVQPLEDVPEQHKDWHPGSDGKVLDLLHPSLFPVVYGVTKVLPTGLVPLEECSSYIGKGETTKLVNRHESEWGLFQWLPSDLKWTPEGGLKISSYVNNLHPARHGDLYKVLEGFATASIPLLEQVVYEGSYGKHPLKPRIQITQTSDEDYEIPAGLVYPGFDKPEEEYDEDELDDIKWSDEYRDWKESVWVLQQPEPPAYEPRNAARADFRKEFPDGLQIIFKLANIHLTPEKPDYGGGSWHIEGALNERICATALYYYDQDNITDSHLAFRHNIDAEELVMLPAQSEYSSLEHYMGVEQDGTTIQDLGKVLTRERRMLAFPNVVQHQVQPFSLVDKTKPGHRKILAMFLVDPHTRILSTSVVPPQRRDWWAEEVRKVPMFGKLPPEVFNINIENVEDFPMSWEQAVEYREALMEERSAITGKVDEDWNEYTFSFCEH